ncbi:MAG: substrate-binding domain-containing protein [Phycisphaeraceae bacterium]
MINGVEKGLEAAGHRANLLIGAGPLSENLLSRRVLEEQSDAVILLAVREGSEYVQLVERLHVPAVVINARSQPQRFSYVGVDNHGGVGDAVGRLVEMGHRRLAMVHNTHQLSYNLERQQGFFDALRERGLEATATLAIDPEADTAEAAYLAAAEQVADAATAVCLTNDHMAVSFIDALETLGVSVPDDVSVVGFDATPSCAASGLRPSSVGYCIDRLAEEAASIIDRLLQEGGLRYLSAILPARFEPRDTTAPPRREASPKPRLQASQAVAVPKE